MDVAQVALLIPIVSVLGGIAIVIVAMLNKARLRELEIRERIAMIERGMVPAPESDPKGFDRAITRLEQTQRIRQLQAHPAGRHRRAGITLMGVGFGLMVLISFADGDTYRGIGVGGFLVVLGLAFFVNALFEARQDAKFESTGPAAPPASPPASPQQR